jgi:hypothetical protein
MAAHPVHRQRPSISSENVFKPVFCLPVEKSIMYQFAVVAAPMLLIDNDIRSYPKRKLLNPQ